MNDYSMDDLASISEHILRHELVDLKYKYPPDEEQAQLLNIECSLSKD